MAKKLKRELSLIEVISVSAGVMISSGLFILPAIAYAQAGPGMILSYALGSLLIIPTVLAKAELVTAMPVTGGIYIFADRSMGPLMGTIGGLTAWISLAFKSAFSLLAMGIFVLLINPNATGMQVKLISIACCLVFTFINLKGVKLSGRVQSLIVIFLVLILVIYVIVGSFSIQAFRYEPFAPLGFNSILTTAGLIFISFSGTTKVTAIAGEVKNPGRNLPLGIFYSWGIVSLLYIIVVFVTVGLLDASELTNTLTPISVGGGKIMGRFGVLIMTIAALMAFVSTGNAGLMAASRNPLAMGKDELLPAFMSKVSHNGTPRVAIMSTSAIMIAVILFLDLETFVKTASALKLVLFIIANLSLIFMREANIHHYRPKYFAPFYPWAPIIGIVSYTFLLSKMGTIPLLLVSAFIIGGILWYFIFAYGRIKREYAILHIIERVTGIGSTDWLLEEELRDILIERDDITDEWFEHSLRKLPVVDMNRSVTGYEIAVLAARRLAKKTHAHQDQLRHLIQNRLQDTDIIVRDGVACLSVKVSGKRKFDILMVRNKEGIFLPDDTAKLIALFIVVYSVDEWNCQIHALSRLINSLEKEDFLKKWLNAKDRKELIQVLLE